MCVPIGVAIAYHTLIEAPGRLRALGASETAVAAVEEQIGYAEELLLEASRLHGMDATQTTEGAAVAEIMYNLGARAQELVTMAEQRATTIAAASLTTGLLLDRAPDLGGLDSAVAELHHETEFVTDVLHALPGIGSPTPEIEPADQPYTPRYVQLGILSA